MKDPQEMMAWFEGKKQAFLALPED